MKLNIAFCYAQRDKALLDKFRTHLEPMEQMGIITTWSDNDIQPGADANEEIKKQLDIADLILLLASPDFVSSRYYGAELNEIIEQHNRKPVILIILRPCDWNTMFSKEVLIRLKVLPSDKKPVVLARNRDQVFSYIVRDIQNIIKKLYTDVKTTIPAIPVSDSETVKVIQKILSLCYRMAIFTPFDEEISTEAMFITLKECRVALQKNITYASSEEVQTVIAEIIGELDLIERLNKPDLTTGSSYIYSRSRVQAINYAKLRIIKALRILSKTIDFPFVLPRSFVEGYFWNEEDIDKAPEKAISPDKEQLLQTWATEELDDKP